MRVDIHTHAFPESIAERAMTALKAHMPPGFVCSDGRLGSLIDDLEAHRFDAAVVCSIATKPAQFEAILHWSDSIRQGAFGDGAARRIVPLISVHPADPDRYQRIEQTAAAGFKGLKVHPYYQDFVLDAPESIDLFHCAQQNGLAVLSHVGFDIAFPRTRLCGPARVRRVLDAVPDLAFIVSHLGGWMDWDEAEALLIGQPIDIEISMALDDLPADRVRDILLRHPIDRIHFGSDWPWSAYDKVLPLIEAMALPPDRFKALMGDNSARLLGLRP